MDITIRTEKEEDIKKELEKFVSMLKEEVIGNIGIIKKLNSGEYPEETKKKMINDICEHLNGYLDLAITFTNRII